MNEITPAIIGTAIKVPKAPGPGLLESADRVCLACELEKRGFTVEQEKPIPVVYEGMKRECGFRADRLVHGRIIGECKAKEALHPVSPAGNV